MAQKNESNVIIGFWRAPLEGRAHVAGRLHEGENVALAWDKSQNPRLVHFTRTLKQRIDGQSGMRTPDTRPGFTPQGLMGEHEFTVIYDHAKKEVKPLTLSILENETGLLDRFNDKDSREAQRYLNEAFAIYTQFRQQLDAAPGALPEKKPVIVERRGPRLSAEALHAARAAARLKPAPAPDAETPPAPPPVTVPVVAPVSIAPAKAEVAAALPTLQLPRRAERNPTVGDLLKAVPDHVTRGYARRIHVLLARQHARPQNG